MDWAYENVLKFMLSVFEYGREQRATGGRLSLNEKECFV
jgi:hypothetical protein